jgi:hypothetical protein
MLFSQFGKEPCILYTILEVLYGRMILVLQYISLFSIRETNMINQNCHCFDRIAFLLSDKDFSIFSYFIS